MSSVLDTMYVFLICLIVGTNVYIFAEVMPAVLAVDDVNTDLTVALMAVVPIPSGTLVYVLLKSKLEERKAERDELV